MCVLAAKPLSPEPPPYSRLHSFLVAPPAKQLQRCGSFPSGPPAPSEAERRFLSVVIERGQLEVGVRPSGSFGNKVVIQSAKTKGGVEGEGGGGMSMLKILPGLPSLT